MQHANIGLGCVTFGREIDAETAYSLMDYAVANGITLFDTAAAYGGGASEKIVGEWLAARPEHQNRVSIATKILPPYNAAQVHKSVKESLERLQVEHVEVLYLHRWDDTLLEPSGWQALSSLLSNGVITKFGVSNFNYAQLMLALPLAAKAGMKISVIQNNNNLAVSDIGPDLKALCVANNIGLITFSPLGAGFLTGKHLNGVAENSRFSMMPAHQDIYFNTEANRRLEKLMEVAAAHELLPAKLAMAWSLHQPVETVLIGARNTGHVDLALEAAKLDRPDVFDLLETP